MKEGGVGGGGGVKCQMDQPPPEKTTLKSPALLGLRLS